jgi:chromosome segregation ATPase
MPKAALEIRALEEKISDLQYSIGRGKDEIRTASRSLGTAQGQKETAQAQHQHHAGNLSHMKEKADTVNLDEWKHTVKATKHAKENLTEAENQIRTHENRVAGLEAAIVKSEKEIERCREKLAAYGRLFAFPGGEPC